MVTTLKPSRGGLLRPFGCGWFIREFLSGNAPYGSSSVDPGIGAPQADIFYYYKMALIQATAFDRATRIEEKMSRRSKRPISPVVIEKLAQEFMARTPYKSSGCRYHSFVVYFSMLQKLGWVEPSGIEEASSFQANYPHGQPRRYFRLTTTGYSVGDGAWANPHSALYGARQ